MLFKHKLAPRNARFCPGCPKKDLKLIKEPTFIITPPSPKIDTKTVTIIGNNRSSNKGKNISLF